MLTCLGLQRLRGIVQRSARRTTHSVLGFLGLGWWRRWFSLLAFGAGRALSAFAFCSLRGLARVGLLGFCLNLLHGRGLELLRRSWWGCCILQCSQPLPGSLSVKRDPIQALYTRIENPQGRQFATRWLPEVLKEPFGHSQKIAPATMSNRTTSEMEGQRPFPEFLH